jgi:hypothetical protein
MLTSCEKDDTCLEPTTPKLILRFYDNTAPQTTKPVEHFTLTALPELQQPIQDKTIDSLSIALDVNNDFSRFVFQNDNNLDTITFMYEREYKFVSKSCGYKSIFHNLQVNIHPDNDNWIKNVTILNSEITIDTVAHVKIYH